VIFRSSPARVAIAAIPLADAAHHQIRSDGWDIGFDSFISPRKRLRSVAVVDCHVSSTSQILQIADFSLPPLDQASST